MMANDGQIAEDTLFGPERLKRVPLIGTEATADFHQGAQPSCCNPDAVYMAAAEIMPASTETLLPRGSHPYMVRERGRTAALLDHKARSFVRSL